MRDRDVASIIGVGVLVVLLFGLLGGGMMGFGGRGPGMMGWYYNQGFAPWWGVVMLLFWALVIGGVALLIGWLVRQGGQAPPGSSREESSLEILKRRYARREITREQYEQMRRDIE